MNAATFATDDRRRECRELFWEVVSEASAPRNR